MLEKIAGYIRVSTIKQRDDGVSIEMQQEMIIKHALMLEIISRPDEIEFYIDDGYSGKSLERPMIKKLIENIKSKKVNIVFCYDLSRLSRDLFDCNTLLKMFDKYEIVIKCIYDQADTTTASGRFSTNIRILNNQYERERIVERTNDSLRAIAESGRYPIGGKMSLGYLRGEDKNIYVHPIDSKVIIKIFVMASKGYTLDEIEMTINTMPNSENAFIDKARILRIIKRRLYTGYFVYKGKEYPDMVPPLIDEETFNQAQRATRKYTKNGRNYIFNNKIICKKCGTVLGNTHGTSANGLKYFYYRCEKCRKIISENMLDVALISNEPIERSFELKRKMLPQIEAKIYNLNNRMSKIKNEYINEVLDDEEYLMLVKPINSKLNKLKNEKKNISDVIDDTLKIRYRDMNSRNEKFSYIYSNVDKIVVNLDDKQVENIFMKE